MSAVISVEGVSKQYRLGEVGTGTLSHDINRWWHRVRGKEDPYLKIGETNDRTKKGSSEYAWALRDISFEVKQGEVLGIIGRNGAGKSTLLKILSRVTTPTTGRIKVKGRIASLLEVGTGFHPELTGRENIYLNGAILGMRRHEITAKFDEIVEFSGCERYIDTPVKRYSSGMYVRLAFAVAAHLEPEILIVDEVLAVGDAEFQKRCLGKMKDVAGQGRTVIFVSHNLAAVDYLCSHAVVMDSGKNIFTGSNSAAIHFYDRHAHSPEYRRAIDFPPPNKKLGLELKAIRMTNRTPGKAPEAAIVAGDTIGFEIDCFATDANRAYGVGIGIQTAHNERLLSFHTKCDAGFHWPAREGAITLQCVAPDLPAANGSYKVSIGTSDGYKTLQIFEGAMNLQITESDFFRNGGQSVPGFIVLRQSWAEKHAS